MENMIMKFGEGAVKFIDSLRLIPGPIRGKQVTDMVKSFVGDFPHNFFNLDVCRTCGTNILFLCSVDGVV